MWVVIAVVVIGGAWWYLSMSQTATAPTASNPAPSAPPAPMPPSNGVSASNNSNATLQSNLSNIDSQMNGFSSDNASVNNGMSDQQVQQSQL